MFGTSPFGRRFGSLFRELEEEMEDMERRMDRMLQDARKSPEATTRGPLMYGWTLNVGPDGVPRIRRFGNLEETTTEGDEGWREPFVTSVFDEDKNVIRVTAELPGVTKDNIDVKTFDDGLQLEALGEDRKYRANLPIEREINPETADAHYNNGILEITVELAEDHERDGHTVSVR